MIIKYPKDYEFTSGISQNSVFLKGPKQWTDVTAKAIESAHPNVVVLVSNEVNITDWDIKYSGDVDILSINFKGLQADVSVLLALKELCRFNPLTYIYIDEACKYISILEGIISKCVVNKMNSPDDLIKIVDEYFKFLTEVNVEEKTPVRGRKKRV